MFAKLIIAVACLVCIWTTIIGKSSAQEESPIFNAIAYANKQISSSFFYKYITNNLKNNILNCNDNKIHRLQIEAKCQHLVNLLNRECALHENKLLSLK